MMKINHILLFGACLISAMGFGQEPLTFEGALAITLEKNYDIRISQVNLEIAENNADRSANGYLPTVSGSGGYNWTYYEGNNKLQTGDQHFDANNSQSYSAGVDVSYTLFDGFGRKNEYQLSSGNLSLTQLDLRQIMESTILDLSLAFHEVARLQQQTASLDTTLSISKQRLLRVQYGYEVGEYIQLDVLNAQVDLNNDSINLLNSRQTEANTKRDLNLIMGVPIETEYEIEEDVSLREIISANDVVNSAITNGTSVRTAEQVRTNADYIIASNQSVWYPRLSANGGYQFSGNENPNGAFAKGSRTYGPTAGVTLSWTIFDGQSRNNVRNSKLQLRTTEIEVERTRSRVTTEALNSHGAYQNALYVLQTSEATVITAQDNFDRSVESYKTGQITSLDFRNAQLNLLKAHLQLSQALYNAKNIELQTLAIMGVLVE